MRQPLLAACIALAAGGHAVAQDLILQTTFAGGGASQGVMFDLTCLNPAGVYLSAFDVGCPTPVFQSPVDVWTRPGTYVGHENSGEGWVYTAHGYFQCGSAPQFYILFTLNGLRLDAGQTIGVYIESSGIAGMEYSPIPPASPEYADAHLRISGGAAKLGNGFASKTQGLSIWNGRVHYDTEAPCYANCDNRTTPPYLTGQDLLCFIGAYAAMSSYANCDRSTGTPQLTANDFMCFMNMYAAGCTAP